MRLPFSCGDPATIYQLEAIKREPGHGSVTWGAPASARIWNVDATVPITELCFGDTIPDCILAIDCSDELRNGAVEAWLDHTINGGLLARILSGRLS